MFRECQPFSYSADERKLMKHFVPERRGLADAHAELKTDGKLSAEHQGIADRTWGQVELSPMSAHTRGQDPPRHDLRVTRCGGNGLFGSDKPRMISMVFIFAVT